jgi:alkylation response protein AidB-like acyl-CoA dehydrogenase
MSTVGISNSIQDLLPSIRSRREEIEQARCMPRDLVEDLGKTGIFSLSVPRAIGGQEAPPLESMQAIETIAAADGSTGWCAMVVLGNNVAAGYMNESGAREIFTSPNIPTAGLAAPAGTAVRVDGGLKVSGRWPFASGITHSDWLWVGCLVTENGQPRMTPQGPEIVHVWLPVKDVTIHDTWHVSGLRGTGSHDVSAQEAFVPDHRTFALLDPAGHRPEPLYQMPPLHLFVFQLVCVSLGIARAALDELNELGRTKVPSLYTVPLADKPVVQVELARAEAALGGARSFLYDTVEDMWNAVSHGKAPSARQLALGRIAATHAAETGAAVARTANTLAGGSSIYTKSSLQRHARDAEAVTHHFTVAAHTWEEAGRVLLGREPTIPVF